MKFAAKARVALDDPDKVIGPLCEHMVEHGGRVDERDGVRTLRFPRSTACFGHENGVTVVDVAAQSLEDLYYVRMTVASHIIEFAGGATAVTWTGDGGDLVRPPNFQILRVVATRDLTPHMRRVTLQAADLGRFAPLNALHLNILVQHPSLAEPQWPTVGANGLVRWEDPERRPSFRKYTVRSLDAEAGTLDIDFVRHADAGPGSAFAEAAKPGDPVGVVGPGGGGLVEADWYLFAGDETALPAIARMLENLPRHARGFALIEVADADEVQPLRQSAQVEVSWLLRNGAAAGTTDLLADAVRRIAFPDDDSRIYVWTGCEFKAFQAIRKYLREERRLKKDEHLAVAYWRLGSSEGGEH